MSSRSGQKRTATSQNPEPSNNHKPKKTRFLEPEEDPVEFEEQVEASLEKSTRRGRIRTEGYESDSTDDGEGVVASRKKTGDGEDAMDDMFAVSGDGEDSKEDKGRKETYIRLGDIEGQEFGGDKKEESESDLEDEPEDEDDMERRKKAGMGFELSSFNMRDEMEEGKFMEDGTYIRHIDPNSVHDRWMEGLSEKEIKIARRRKRESEKKQKEMMLAEEKELKEGGGKGSMERNLLPYLKKGETVLEALQRLGSKSKKSQDNKSKSKSKALEAVHPDEHRPKNNVLNDVETITHLASNLMSLGDTDIYNTTYEQLVRSVRSSGIVSQNWEPPSADIMYEYKWSFPEAGQADQVFGPFGEEELKSWFNAMYFGPSGEKINIRQVGGEWGDWDHVF